MKERKTTVELALLIIILSNIFCFEDRMKSTHLTKDYYYYYYQQFSLKKSNNLIHISLSPFKKKLLVDLWMILQSK